MIRAAVRNHDWLQRAWIARARQLRRQRIAYVSVFLFLAGIAAAPAFAAGTPGKCTGRFVNPLTDICWSCLFPMSVGGLNIWPSLAGRPATDNPDLPVCACGLRLGIAMGFWEPVRTRRRLVALRGC